MVDEKSQPEQIEVATEHHEYDTSITSPGSPVEEEPTPRLNWQTWMAIVVSVVLLIQRDSRTDGNSVAYIPIQFIPLHTYHASCSSGVHQRRYWARQELHLDHHFVSLHGNFSSVRNLIKVADGISAQQLSSPSPAVSPIFSVAAGS